METSKIIELLSYTLPSVVTGAVAYYFFFLHTKNEDNRRRYLMSKDLKKEAMPMRLQAYERMTLFLERIGFANLLVRIAPISSNKNDYENFIIAHIEQEFEHNLTQQIYMTDECWALINSAKNATIQIIRNAALNDAVTNADELRELILTNLIEKKSPNQTALSYIKNEVSMMWQ